ncbi:MAG: tetratricopeptide repeat protein [Bacteroidetes bacterium]|nr:tetratricopeptide repeat protein [Bacteroidota bacterium]
MKIRISLFIYILSFSLSFVVQASSTSKTDSLRVLLYKAENDSTRSSLYLDMGDSFGYSTLDSSIYFYKKSLEISVKKGYKRQQAMAFLNMGIAFHYQGELDSALVNYQKALVIREDLGDNLGMARSYNNMGIIYRIHGNYENAILAYEKCLEIYEEFNDPDALSRAFNNLGIVYHDMGNYDKSVEYQFKSLKVNEDAGNKEGMSRAYNNIGLIYQNQGDYDSAIKYLELSLKLVEELGDKRGMAARYNNLGIIYSDLKEYEKALDFHTKSLKIKEEISDKLGMSSSYTNLGNIYRSIGDYPKSISFYQKALKIDEEMGDKNGMAIVFNNISNLHLIIADSVPGADFDDNINKAIYYGNKSYQLAVEIGAIPVQNNTSENMLNAFKRIGNYKEALKFAEIYIKTNKQMFNEEKTQALTEMQTKYETEKKQQEIENQNLIIEKQDLENKRQRTQISFFIAGSILLIVLVIFIFTGYQQKKRSNIIITEKNALLIEANEEINAQKEEIEVQHNMVIKQKEHIEIQKEKIESSIRYAKRIQTAVLPKDNKIDQIIGDHFVLFRPKDVVSGDFYWATNIGEWLFVAVADCTGHGVPGAFMSMLGVSFLNEIVRKKDVNNPSQVLDHLRASIIDALDQSSAEGSQNDGMDISFLALNKEKNECLWAGAGLPIWIIRKNKISEGADQDIIEVIKPDKMTIAISPRMNEFTYHKFSIEKGDRAYMFTDGILDQFGGPEEKKFMSRQLKAIISSTSTLTIREQHIAIETALNNWISPFEGFSFNQIDDITLLGLEF